MVVGTRMKYTDNDGWIQTKVDSGTNDEIASSRRQAWTIRVPSVRPPTHRWVAGHLQLLIAEHIVLAGVALGEEERGERGER